MFIPISAVLFFLQRLFFGDLGLGLEDAGLGLGLGLETTGLGLGTLVLTTRLQNSDNSDKYRTNHPLRLSLHAVDFINKVRWSATTHCPNQRTFDSAVCRYNRPTNAPASRTMAFTPQCSLVMTHYLASINRY